MLTLRFYNYRVYYTNKYIRKRFMSTYTRLIFTKKKGSKEIGQSELLSCQTKKSYKSLFITKYFFGSDFVDSYTILMRTHFRPTQRDLDILEILRFLPARYNSLWKDFEIFYSSRKWKKFNATLDKAKIIVITLQLSK